MFSHGIARFIHDPAGSEASVGAGLSGDKVPVVSFFKETDTHAFLLFCQTGEAVSFGYFFDLCFRVISQRGDDPV